MSEELPVGRVVSVSPQGTVLVKSPSPLPVKRGLRLGSSVVDARRQRVGRVTDVIGPVAAPYVLVQPDRGAKLHRLPGTDLYAQSKSERPARRRR